jgi:ribA/ribD-fused uncharacterized protein
MKIYRFVNEYEFLSNFYPAIIIFEGVRYLTLEHAFVASKTLDKQFRKRIARLPAKDAGLAKSMGRKCKLRPGWDEIKIRMMKDFLFQKFSQEPFKTKLLETGDQELVEGNYWHDNFWGDCICEKCDELIPGENNLGKLLMEVRQKLKGNNKNVSTVCYTAHDCGGGISPEIHSGHDSEGNDEGAKH